MEEGAAAVEDTNEDEDKDEDEDEDEDENEDKVTQNKMSADQQDVSTSGCAEHSVTAVVIDTAQRRMGIRSYPPQKTN